jgi:alpha-galactosidase
MIEFENGSFYFHLNDGKQFIVGLGRLWVAGLTNDQKNFTFSIPFNQIEFQMIDSRSKKCVSRGSDTSSGLVWRVEFLLPKDGLNVRWKISLHNHSIAPVYIQKITLLDHSESTAQNLFLNQPAKIENLSFYSNGWQSWSTTGSYNTGDKMRTTGLGFLHEPMVYNPGTPIYRNRGSFSSDFFSVIVDKQTRCGVLIGFLSQREHFGSITADFRRSPILKMWANGDNARLDPGQSIETDWAVMVPLDLAGEDVWKDYLDDVAIENNIGKLPDPPVGWCSWYHFYQGISQAVIEENLEKIKEFKDQLPFNLVQIDDGFQKQVGDWLEFNDRFPYGVRPLAEEIKHVGCTPGLWLAPFILHPRAKSVCEHPDWLLRHQNGSLVRPGFVWNSLGAALDLTHPGAQDYVREVIGTAVHQWGFPYLKLDFLYVAALKGKFQDPRRTRAQVLRLGMETIREAAGKKALLVGCGAPLGSMLGMVDVMRIGPDVNGSWTPSFAGISLPFKSEPSMPSERNSMQNIFSRSPLHNRWWVNDPDCLLVRPESKLTLPEIQSMATAIALTGGSLVVSDDMTKLPPERLRILSTLMPLMNQQPVVLDMFDSKRPSRLRLDLQGVVGQWHLLAYFNWRDHDFKTELGLDEFGLSAGGYHIRSFWDDRNWRTNEVESVFSGKIPPHGVVLLAIRKTDDSSAAYLGSDLHISQGHEIAYWEVGKNELKFDIRSGKKLSGKVDFYLKSEPSNVNVDGKSSPWELIGLNTFRIMAPDKDRSSVSINF